MFLLDRDTRTTFELRPADERDLQFILRAQEASHYELTPYAPEVVKEALVSGELEGYVLETGEAKTLVCVTAQGEDAMLTAFYREGNRMGLMRDATRLLGLVRASLRSRGVTTMYACISRRNPRFAKLAKFYRRLEFEADMVRMSGRV